MCIINNNLCIKLVSSLEFSITFHEIFKVTLVPFFIRDFNLLSCELDEFTFKVSHYAKQNKFTILSQFFVRNLKWFLSILQQRKVLLYLHLNLELYFLYRQTVSLTNCSFSNLIICPQIIFYRLIYKALSIDHNIIIFYFYSYKIIFCVYFSICIIFK